MKFHKYYSIENSYRSKYIENAIFNNPEIENSKYVLQEKVHGANFQICFEKNNNKINILYGRRTAFLHPDENFYSWQEVVKSLQSEIKTLKNNLFSFPIFKNANAIICYGELFGGNIQAGIDYSKIKKIVFYDIYAINSIDEDNIYLTPKQMENIFNILGLTHLLIPKVIILNSLKEALNYDISTTYTFLYDGTLNIAKNIVVEGVVIKPYDKILKDQFNRIFVLKKKNSWASERKSRKKIVKLTNYSKEFTFLKNIFESYLTTNRLNNVFSKEGKINELSEIGKYIKLVVKDAKIDFFKDHIDNFKNLNKKEQKKIFAGAGKIIKNLLIEYL